jgi:hypothetical protein
VFYQTSPAVVLALPLADFLLWEAQAFRIRDEQRRVSVEDAA